MLKTLATAFVMVSIASSSASKEESKARVYDLNGRVEINRDYWHKLPQSFAFYLIVSLK